MALCAPRNDTPRGGPSAPTGGGSGIVRFVDSSGAEIPRWIRLRLQAFGDDVESIKAFGLDVVTELCDPLRQNGVPGLHFYTMNQSTTTLAIYKRLGWKPENGLA